jgi:hypothetical protein
MFAQIKETLNEGLHNRYEISYRFDEKLDIVSKYYKTYSFYKLLEFSFFNNNVDNYWQIIENLFPLLNQIT